MNGDIAPDRVRCVAVSVQKSVALLRAGEHVENLLAGCGRAERDQATGEQLGVDSDVGVEAEEGRRCPASQTVEAGEDLVEDDREAGPGRRGLWLRCRSICSDERWC